MLVTNRTLESWSKRGCSRSSRRSLWSFVVCANSSRSAASAASRCVFRASWMKRSSRATLQEQRDDEQYELPFRDRAEGGLVADLLGSEVLAARSEGRRDRARRHRARALASLPMGRT